MKVRILNREVRGVRNLRNLHYTLVLLDDDDMSPEDHTIGMVILDGLRKA